MNPLVSSISNHTKFNRISDLCTKSICWNLRAKLLRSWYSTHLKSGPSLGLIFADEEGGRIEATAYGNNARRFLFLLNKEGFWFILRDFRVSWGIVAKPKVGPTYYEIGIMSDTMISENIDPPTWNELLDIKPLEAINDGTVSDKYPIDVVGAITWVGKIEWKDDSSEFYEYKRTVAKIQFTLRDSERRAIECIAFGKIAEDLSKRFSGTHDRHLFVLLRFFWIERCSGYTWLKAREGPSDIEFDRHGLHELSMLMDSYPNPPPTWYHNYHKWGFTIF